MTQALKSTELDRRARELLAAEWQPRSPLERQWLMAPEDGCDVLIPAKVCLRAVVAALSSLSAANAVDIKDLGRVVPTGLSQAEPQEGLGPTGFDPSRMMRDFYLSRYYEPKAERPADNVQAAIEFALDRVAERLEARAEHILAVGATEQGEQFGKFMQGWKQGAYNHLYLAASEIGRNLRSDSDGSPEGEDALAASSETTARACKASPKPPIQEPQT